MVTARQVAEAVEGQWKKRQEPVIDLIRTASAVVLVLETGSKLVLHGSDLLKKYAQAEPDELDQMHASGGILMITANSKTAEPEVVAAAVKLLKGASV